MNDLGYVQDHDLLKVPDAVLLKESRKENKKLQDENNALSQKIKELYDKLEKAQEKVELDITTTLSKEEIAELKLNEMYVRQKEENQILQKRLHELRQHVDKSFWKELKLIR